MFLVILLGLLWLILFFIEGLLILGSIANIFIAVQDKNYDEKYQVILLLAITIVMGIVVYESYYLLREATILLVS